jgi:hypothetical protein
MQFQETTTQTLTSDISEIVKAIENSEPMLVEKLQEAQRQKELWHLKMLAEEELRRQEEDQRRIQQSKKDSHAHLLQVIQSWSDVMNLENFFAGVQNRASLLPAPERDAVMERLNLARQFVGAQNPLDFFAAWKTPTERYQPREQIKAGAVGADELLDNSDKDCL